MIHPNADAYLDDLRTALELRDTGEDQTLDIIRQTRSHLIDTGKIHSTHSETLVTMRNSTRRIQLRPGSGRSS